VAGVGGVIYYPGGQLSLSCSWILGEETNNQAEAYVIFKVLSLDRSQGFKDIFRLGDSWMIITLIRK
jgi:ribonuclease HI